MSKTAYDTACEFFAEDDFAQWEPDKLEAERQDLAQCLTEFASNESVKLIRALARTAALAYPAAYGAQAEEGKVIILPHRETLIECDIDEQAETIAAEVHRCIGEQIRNVAPKPQTLLIACIRDGQNIIAPITLRGFSSSRVVITADTKEGRVIATGANKSDAVTNLCGQIGYTQHLWHDYDDTLKRVVQHLYPDADRIRVIII